MHLAELRRTDGRAALVTGSARGIGKAIALALAAGGARVAVHGTAPGAALEATLAAVRALSPTSVAVTGNLAQPETASRIVAEAAAALDALDILVANAGTSVRKRWEDITPEEAEQQMQVNFHASWRMMQAAVPAMRSKGWGRILAIGSSQQQCPNAALAIYAASKAAQENLVRNLARQLGPFGITVNNLSPGVVKTDRNVPRLADEAFADRLRAVIPVSFFGETEDCAAAATLLCSDAGRYINGADIRVDGGRTA